jgi:hypothetical protein
MADALSFQPAYDVAVTLLSLGTTGQRMKREAVLLVVMGTVMLPWLLVGCAGAASDDSDQQQARQSSVSGMSTQPTENTMANGDTRQYKCPGYHVCGTEGDDSLRGTAEAEYIEGLKGNDTLEGLGGDDYLYGSDSYLYDPGERGNDTLLGGTGYDHLYGEQGNDTLNGGPGPDWYHFEQGWGKDTIVDSTPTVPSDIKRDDLGNPIGVDYRDRVDLVEFGAVTDDLSIDLASDSGPNPEVNNPGGTHAVNWDANAIENITGGGGDDTIKGNDSANSINLSYGIYREQKRMCIQLCTVYSIRAPSSPRLTVRKWSGFLN